MLMDSGNGCQLVAGGLLLDGLPAVRWFGLLLKDSQLVAGALMLKDSGNDCQLFAGGLLLQDPQRFAGALMLNDCQLFAGGLLLQDPQRFAGALMLNDCQLFAGGLLLDGFREWLPAGRWWSFAR